jgi:hypothetical protein
MAPKGSLRSSGGGLAPRFGNGEKGRRPRDTVMSVSPMEKTGTGNGLKFVTVVLTSTQELPSVTE